MCGRFTLFSDAKVIQNEFSLNHTPLLELRYNLARGRDHGRDHAWQSPLRCPFFPLGFDPLLGQG